MSLPRSFDPSRIKTEHPRTWETENPSRSPLFPIPLVDALRRRSGGGTQRVYAVVDLDEESMQVAKPHRAGLMRPVRKKFARATGLHGFFSKKGRS